MCLSESDIAMEESIKLTMKEWNMRHDGKQLVSSLFERGL